VSLGNWIPAGFFQVELKFPCIFNFAKVASLYLSFTDKLDIEWRRRIYLLFT